MPVRPVDPNEFAFPGGTVGCLLLHGFSGTPYEMRYLGERLHEQGYTVRGVRLPGHAVDDEEAAGAGWRDWYGAACTGLEAMRRECESVFVVGLSMGSLLALHLAHERGREVVGVGLLAPALVTDKWLIRYVPLLRPVLPLLPVRWQTVAKRGSDILDEAARSVHPRFRISLRGVADLAILQDRVRRLLPRITHPALILHGRHDRTCPIESAETVRREIGSRLVRFRILERSAHVITVDSEKDVVVEEVSTFIGDVQKQSRCHVEEIFEP